MSSQGTCFALTSAGSASVHRENAAGGGSSSTFGAPTACRHYYEASECAYTSRPWSGFFFSGSGRLKTRAGRSFRSAGSGRGGEHNSFAFAGAGTGGFAFYSATAGWREARPVRWASAKSHSYND